MCHFPMMTMIILHSYNWFVDGSPLGLDSSTIDGQYFDRDQDIYCTMTPNDGLTNGITVSSNQVTIKIQFCSSNSIGSIDS